MPQSQLLYAATKPINGAAVKSVNQIYANGPDAGYVPYFVSWVLARSNAAFRAPVSLIPLSALRAA